MDVEPHCVYSWSASSSEGSDRDDCYVYEFLLTKPNAIYDKFHEFLQLPSELRLKIYDYAFGYQEIVSTLDTNGQMRIHYIYEDDHHERGEWSCKWDNSSLYWYNRTVPPLLLSCRQIHDETEPVLYSNTLYTFTMTDLHDPKVGPTYIRRFLPRMKHESLSLSIFEVYECWYGRRGAALLEELCIAFFKLVNTKIPQLVSFSLEMKMSHSHCFRVMSCEAISLDDYPDPHPMPNETFQGILNAWLTLRLNGRVNFEGVFDKSFDQSSPGYDYWFQPLYAGFWKDFGTAENERLFRIRHPDMVTYYESRLSGKNRSYYKRYKCS